MDKSESIISPIKVLFYLYVNFLVCMFTASLFVLCNVLILPFSVVKLVRPSSSAIFLLEQK